MSIDWSSERLIEWAYERRGAVLIALAVWVLAVPTFFAEFTEATTWSLNIRVPIGIVWVVAALAATVIATNQDDRLRRHLDANLKQVRHREDRVQYSVLKALLSESSTGAPHCFSWTVSLIGEGGFLQPIFPEPLTDANDPRVFAKGTGVCGFAVEGNGLVTAMGEAVSSDKFLLTAEQRSYFASYLAVVAVPLLDRAGKPFGAISGISEEASRHFESSTASEQLRNLADVVAGVLIKFAPK